MRLLGTGAAFAVIIVAALLGSGLVLLPEGGRAVENHTTEHREFLLFSVETTRYPANASLAALEPNVTLGVTVEGWNLNFGSFPRFSTARRFLELQNPSVVPAKVMLFGAGNISSMIGFSETVFILSPGEARNVSVILTGSSPIGNYTGSIGARIVTPRFPQASGLLRWVV